MIREAQERLKFIQPYQIVLLIIAGSIWLVFRPSFRFSIAIVGFFWMLFMIINTCEEDSNAQNSSGTDVGV